MTSNGWLSSILHWAVTHMHDTTKSIVSDIPLVTLLLVARQEQYSMDDRVMTLGDKELIEKLNKEKMTRCRNG